MLAGMFLAAEILVNVECMSHSGGTMPEWFPVHWWSFTDLHRDCQSNYQKGFNPGVATNYAFNVIMALGVLAFAVNWLVRGARTVLGSVHTTGIEANI